MGEAEEDYCGKREALEIIVVVLSERGQEEITRLGLEIGFDVQNPEVQKWLKSYVPKFSKKLEEVNIKRLRKQLLEGLEAGEGIPKLIKRVNETYANWNKIRSRAIARTETLRASNRGALEAYRQSGVVKKKVWITHFDKRTCVWCEDMNGKTVSIEKAFIEGDSFTVTEDGKNRTLDISYEEIQSPPLHGLCRCSPSAWFEE